jgi:hypothetical protein
MRGLVGMIMSWGFTALLIYVGFVILHNNPGLPGTIGHGLKVGASDIATGFSNFVHGLSS